MAAFVEFIGVPGAGKSSLYREVARRWRRRDNWVPVEILLQAKPILGAGVLGAFEKRFRSITGRRLGIDQSEIRLAGHRFVAEHPWFASATWRAIERSYPTEEGGPLGEVRFELATFWLDQCGRVQLIKESEDDRVCVIDEGLFHNNFLATSLPCGQAAVEAVTRAVPVSPHGVVYCKAPVDIAWARQLQRGLTVAYKSYPPDTVPLKLTRSRHRASVMHAHFVAAGIPVLEVDTEDALDENARRIRSFLVALHTHAR